MPDMKMRNNFAGIKIRKMLLWEPKRTTMVIDAETSSRSAVNTTYSSYKTSIIKRRRYVPIGGWTAEPLEARQWTLEKLGQRWLLWCYESHVPVYKE